MVRTRYAVLAFVTTALLLGCMVPVSAKEMPRPGGERESFDFKEKRKVLEDWYGIFLEGKHVGWRHVVVSRVKSGTEHMYLYERTGHLEFGRQTRDVEIKALYDLKFRAVAMLMTEQTPKIKMETYVGAAYDVPAEGSEHQLRELSVDRKFGDRGFRSIVRGGIAEPVLFDFAVQHYFRHLRKRKPEEAEELWVFDTTSAALQELQLVGSKPEKRKIDGVETEVREVYVGGKAYYFNKSVFEPVLIVDIVRNLRFIRGSAGEAKSKDKTDQDYVADPNLKDDSYMDRKAGFSIRRPSGDWSILVQHRMPLTMLAVSGLITDGKALGMVCTGIPAGTDVKTASSILTRLMSTEIQQIFGWRLEIGKEEKVEHKQGDHERLDSSLRVKCNMFTLEGRCSVILKGNVAMILFTASPSERSGENEKELNRILDSVTLTPVRLVDPPQHEDKKHGFKITLPDMLWTLKETEQEIELDNRWNQIRGGISVEPSVPGDKTLEEFAKRYLDVAGKMGFVQRRSRRITLDGQDALEYTLKGPMPGIGSDTRMKACFVIKDRIGYVIWAVMPARQYKKSAEPIDSLFKGLKFTKPRP